MQLVAMEIEQPTSAKSCFQDASRFGYLEETCSEFQAIIFQKIFISDMEHTLVAKYIDRINMNFPSILKRLQLGDVLFDDFSCVLRYRLCGRPVLIHHKCFLLMSSLALYSFNILY